MSFSVFNSTVALVSGDSLLIYNLDDNTENVITLPKLQIEKEIKAHNKEDIDSFHTLTSVSFSNDGQYLVVCANRKQLCLYKTENLQLVSNRTISRAASRVRFLPNNDIVVADKTGDAYLFSTCNPNESGQLLLGHLSMLLDILVTHDEKYVITADRDEKIRVSLFPNSYNILSYCLGHKNFVTNIGIIPHDKSILVSGGGDGTLMFWDFQAGKELSKVYFHEKLTQNDLIQVNQTLKENDLDEQVTVSPIKHLRLSQISKDTSIISVSFYCSNIILVYKVSNGHNNLEIEYLESLTVDKEPLECLYREDQLWILTDSKIQIFRYNGKNFISDVEMQKLNELWNKLHNASIRTLLPVLYKRKFDNVHEYQERKKSRINK